MAAVLREPGAVDVRDDWPEPSCGPDEVIVAVRAVGLCGSDLAVFTGKRAVPALPWVLGHEAIGDIVAVGERVADRAVGQFRYLIVPHDGTLPFGRLTRLADEMRTPLRPQLEGFHRGDYPPARTFAATSEANILLTVLKAAEDAPDDVTVVRAVEGSGVPADARISLDFLQRSFEAHFRPYEIKTFLIPDDPGIPVSEATMLEWTDDELATLTGRARPSTTPLTPDR